MSFDRQSTGGRTESNKSRQKIFNGVVGVICQRFPATFFIHKPKPLKIGIYDDLLTLGVLDQKGLSAFLRALSGGRAYCKLGRVYGGENGTRLVLMSPARNGAPVTPLIPVLLAAMPRWSSVK
jgi:hypothetical protein